MLWGKVGGQDKYGAGMSRCNIFASSCQGYLMSLGEERVGILFTGFLTALCDIELQAYSTSDSINWENKTLTAVQHLAGMQWSIHSLVIKSTPRMGCPGHEGGKSLAKAAMFSSAWSRQANEGGNKMTTEINGRFKIRIIAGKDIKLKLKS